MKIVARNEHGLVEGLDYKFSGDGLVDWRKMIPEEFLVPNGEFFNKRNETIPTSIEGLTDNQLLILLGGIKHLAYLRGYSSVEYNVVSPLPEYVVTTCKISWIPNFETENRPVIFSGIGDASLSNTNNFGKLFLGAISENRAFVRCVRNFLRINIVGKDELAPDVPNGSPEAGDSESIVTDPRPLLLSLMEKKGVSFEVVQNKLITEGIEGADKFKSVTDIPKIKVFELIERLNKKR